MVHASPKKKQEGMSVMKVRHENAAALAAEFEFSRRLSGFQCNINLWGFLKS